MPFFEQIEHPRFDIFFAHILRFEIAYFPSETGTEITQIVTVGFHCP
jgi:hypothetical protein